jgi:4-amino-4-deoxy-L-arabinose transferase-like glycosyltransferase
MSKPVPRDRHSKKQARPHKEKMLPPVKQQSKKKVVVFIIVAILAAIPFSMGKYIEFNSPSAFDSGAYVYSAKHILDGAKIGVEERPSARLGTLLVNILGVWLFGFTDIGPKFVQMILQAAGLVLMFIAMRKLFGTLAAAIGVIVASVYLSSPLIAKYGNVKEQYMIAFMLIGVSCFVLYQLGGRWWLAILAGAFVSWAPLFKPTGTSAVGAIGLFVILQPVLKHRTWKQTVIDIGLLTAGAAIALGPLYVWIIGWNVRLSLPYNFVMPTVRKQLRAIGIISAASASKKGGGYVTRSREFVPFAVQWPRVLRYYGLLILPIALAAGAIAARIARMIWKAAMAGKINGKSYDRFVFLFAIWWILDMAFVWISPRSYEQYYLPLNASAAMLGGYPIALYRDKISSAVSRTGWVIAGLVGFLLMVVLSWHIFFGITKSPHSGAKYKNPNVT